MPLKDSFEPRPRCHEIEISHMFKRFVIKTAADTLVSHEPTNTILFSTIAATNFRPRNLQLEAGVWKPKNYLSYAEQEPLESRKLDYRHHTNHTNHTLSCTII